MEKMTRREILRRSAVAVGVPIGLPLVSSAGATEKAKADQSLKILVVGGHPDDPETGCGGTIARYADGGHEVAAVYLTRGEAGIRGKSHQEAALIRTAEAEAACRILGARPIFVGQVDGDTEVNAKRYNEFFRIIDSEKPDICFTHWPVDTHRDHRVASMLAYDSWLNLGKSFALYYYEVMTGSQTQNFNPTHYVDIATTEARKRDACYCHKSQDPVGMYSHHDTMNRFRGMESGNRFAEAFVLQSQTSAQSII